MSWVSTALYYESINKQVARQLGGLSSAPLLIESLDFAAVARLQQAGEWEALSEIMIASAKRLEQAGAEALILCSNTAHKMHDWIDGEIRIPMLHIGDVVAEKLNRDGVKRAGLLGTAITMNDAFYRERFEAHGIQIALPEPGMRAEIDRIIFDELARGQVSRVAQRTLKTCITMLGQARNQAVILGCTELVMLVDPVANVLPVYDSTALHAQAAVDWIMSGESASAEPAGLAAAG